MLCRIQTDSNELQDKSKAKGYFNVPNFEKDSLNTQPSPPIPMIKNKMGMLKLAGCEEERFEQKRCEAQSYSSICQNNLSCGSQFV
jgi:hypothetical protein